MNQTKTILLLLFLSFFATALFAQDFTHDATLVSQRGPVITVKSTGMHPKKKEATFMAIKSAFDTYFFYGIEGLNNGKPLLTKKEQEAAEKYLEMFFDDKNMKYMSYVASYEEDKKPLKLPNKMFRATATFQIYNESLLKDMLRNNIRSKTAAEKEVEEIQEEVYQPTIMVVPYKQQGQGYKQMLTETRYVDLRAGIATVQDEFVKRGFEIKDVMAVLEATEKSMQFESNTSIESFDSQLINSSGADVYVTLDAGYNQGSEGTMASIALVAYERASGKVLASKQTTTRRFVKATLADLYRIGIQMLAEDFMDGVTLAYAKKADKGNTFVLRVSVGNNSDIDLDEIIDSQGLPLSDILRLWMRKNAFKGRFHVQGATKDLLIFDEFQVQSKAAEGYFIDANDFALDIFQYLRNDVGVKCDKRVDGSTIYITIDE